MNFITAVKTILMLLPAIIQAVKAIEDVLPDSNKGDEKLKLIRASVQAAYDGMTEKVGIFEEIWKIVEPTVAAVVTFAKTTGVFKK